MHTNPIINTDNYVKLITFHRYIVHDNVINYFCKKIHYAENKCSVGYETIFSSPDKLSRLYGNFFFFNIFYVECMHRLLSTNMFS